MIYAQAWFIKKDELIDIDTVMGSKPKNLTEAELQIDASIICHIALTLADGRA